MAKIENYQYTVQEAFHQNFYSIPDYQREYVWKEREVSQLLEDISEQLDGSSDAPYFIGMVLVSPKTVSNEFDVIDGQQRLTTFFLLLCAIKYRFVAGSQSHEVMKSILTSNYFDDEGRPVSRPKLDPRYENASEVTSRVAASDLSVEALRSELRVAGLALNGSIGLLVNAYETIGQFLDNNYPTPDLMQKFWGFVASKVVFIQITTDVSSALKIFETINERGVGLSPMDLLKNLLFVNVTPDDFTQLKNVWKGVTGPLEKEKQKPLRFLRYFLMANYPIRSKDGIIREDGIYDWLTNKENAATVGYQQDPFAFVRRLDKAVGFYVGFLNGNGNNGLQSPAIKRLQLLTGGAFSLHNILLIAAAPLPQPLFEKFVEQLENYLFSFIFTNSPSKELERNFSAWAEELRQICSIQNPDEQLGELNNFIAARFAVGAAAKQSQLRDDLLRYTTASMQQYRTSYLLMRLTEYVDRAFNGSSFKGVQDLTMYKNLELEHILPANPSAGLRQKWSAMNADSDYDQFKLKLGNLTLLEKPHNIVARNYEHSIKMAEYAKSANYLTRSIVELKDVGANTTVTAINKYLTAYPVWDASSILDRQNRLVELASAVWKIDSSLT